MHELPYVDTHSVPVAAGTDAVWAALVRVLPLLTAGPFASLLGCDPVHTSAPFHAKPGDTIAGFRVIESEPARRLLLRGSHHFSTYALCFELAPASLLAHTHAAFPGLRGALYRAAVIGTGAHALATRHMLQRIAAAAAR